MKYNYIDNREDLVKICDEQLFDADIIALDTEFIRRDTYWPILSLIQIATRDAIYIIDAKSITELDVLWDVIYSPDIVKVIHASHQDLEIFVHQTGVVPKNVFDTQTAALFAGFRDSIGYRALINELLSQDIDKSEQYTNWLKRPLSQKQLDYAASDVAHLIEAHDKLKAKLDKQGRYTWFMEEMRNYLQPEKFVTEPKQAWRKLRLAPWKAAHQTMLAGLAEWRENEARKINRAKSKVINDAELGKVAKSSCVPEQFPEKFPGIWNRLEGLNLTESFTSAYIESTKASRQAPLPKSIEPLSCLNQEQLRHYEFLKVVLTALSKELQLPSWLLAEKQELELYVRGADDLPKYTAKKAGWRQEAVWQVMQEASQGKAGVSLKDGEPLLIWSQSQEKIGFCKTLCDFLQKTLGK